MRRLRPLVGFLAAAASAFAFLLAAPAASAADIGFIGPSTSGAPGDISGEKPESKLWLNDNTWWASMWDTTSSRYEIFKLDTATQTWISTDTAIDPRSDSRADTLWDGSKLYVASHRFRTPPALGVAGDEARLYRFSYDSGTQTYTLDAGFPATINGWKTETLVIDKDTQGTLWATWMQQKKIFVSHTSAGDDTSWVTPFTLPFPGQSSGLINDDISSLVAFSGRIGVMWSNQADDDTMYFAYHTDGTADTAWTLEPAYGGPATNLADDHIDLKTSGGVVYAVTKTSKTVSTDPLIVLNVRSVSGTWSNHVVSTEAENHTRPMALIDESSATLHVFAGRTSGADAIYEKTTPLSSISFAPGLGTPVIDPEATGVNVNNPTSTKQNLSSTTQLVVVATTDGGGNYWHHFEAFGDVTPPTVTVKVPDTGATDVSVSTNVTATFSENVKGLNGSTFTLAPTAGGPNVSASVSYSAVTDIATLDPAGDLSPGTQYTATLTGGPSAIRDLGNIALTTLSWSFTTAGSAGSVLTFTPTHDTRNDSNQPTATFGTNTDVRVRLSGPTMNTYLKFDVTGVTGTVQSAKVQLFVTDASPSGGSIFTVSNDFLGTSDPWTEAALSWNNAPAISGTPLSTLGSVAVGTWVELDVTGAITGDDTYSFGISNQSTNAVRYSSKEGANDPQLVITLDAGPDVTPPTVTVTSPLDNATGVPVGANVTATFSEDVQGVSGSTFTLTPDGGASIGASVSYDAPSRTATLDPTDPLAPDTHYTANLTSGITDLANPPNSLAPTSFDFTTAAADNTPPTVTVTSPLDNATGVPVGANVTATFSEDVQGVSGSTFTLTPDGGASIGASVSYDAPSRTATLDPTDPLAPDTHYTANLTSGITDLANPPNSLAPTSFDFTTASAPSGAIALAGSAISGAIDTGSTVTLPSWTPAADDVILVAVSQRDETIAISVSGNCPTWTEVANVDNVQGQGGISLWWAKCPSPSAGQITVTLTGNTQPVAVIAQRFSGVNSTTPVEASATNPGPSADNADMLQAVTTQTANAWAVAVGWHRNQTLTVPAGETAILVNHLAGTFGATTRASMWFEGPVASPASTQLGATGDLSAAGDWAMVAISLKPA